MIVLDAYAMEAYLAGEPAAAPVEALLLSGEQIVVNGVNYVELVDRFIRVHGVDATEVIADIVSTGTTVSDLDPDLAASAGMLRARHYHRQTRAVSLADCCAAAHALDRGARLATADPALIDLMVAEGGTVEILPRSNGSIYEPRA